MPGPTFLDGDDVTLRTAERADVSFFHQWSNDPAMRRATGEQSVPITHEQEERHYDSVIEDENAVLLLICLETEPIGAIELEVVAPEADAGELAYWLVPEHRGGGHARDAVSRVVQYAFEELGLHRVEAQVFEFNDGSKRLLERLGFSEEGRHRQNHFTDGRYYDTLVFGLLVDEWDE